MSRMLWIVLLMQLTTLGYSQKVEVRGAVVDNTNEVLPFVRVSSGLDTTYSDLNGAFRINVSSGDTITVGGGLYATTKLVFDADTSGVVITLTPYTLTSVTVTGRRRLATENYFLKPAQLRTLPALGGEVDVFRSLQQLPGVSGTAEGRAVVQIRGGSPDQTSVLVNDIPIFFPSLFFGFISSINFEAVEDVELYTSAFPAHIGGRLSGIVAVNTMRGHADKHRKRISVGFPNVGFSADGPLLGGTYQLASRASYLVLPVALSRNRFVQADLTATYRRSLGAWKLRFTGFANRSDVRLGSTERVEESSTTGYGNVSAGVLLSKSAQRSSLSFGTYYTQYTNSVLESGILLSSRFNNGIRVVQSDLRYNRYYRKLTLYSSLSLNQTAALNSIRADRAGMSPHIDARSSVANAFASLAAMYPITDRLSLYAGSRLSVTFNKLELLEGSTHLEPRVKLSYSVKSLFAAIAIDKMRQDIHQLERAVSAGSFSSIYTPSRAYPTSSSWQASASIGTTALFTSWIDARAAIYSKRLQDVLYRRNTNRSLPESLAAPTPNLVSGNGTVGGVELMVTATKPSFGVRVSYTYEDSRRRFRNVNRGRSFPYRWNRKHNLGLLATLRPSSNRWEFSSNFTFQSGYAFSYPSAVVYSDFQPGFGQPTLYFDDINAIRSAPHHRLDFSAMRELSKRGDRTSRLIFSLYNAYARKNPSATVISVDQSIQPDLVTATYAVNVQERSVFRFIPGVQYSLSW